MDDITRRFRENNFVSRMLDALPCGILAISEDGNVVRLNNVTEQIFGVKNAELIGKGYGKALRCRFRRDLYYRLCVMPVKIPPLRERGGDIELLAKHFLKQFSEESFRGNINLSERTISILNKHHWPGNCRELQNVIQYTLVQCQGNMIEPEYLPANLFAAGAENFIQPRRAPKLDDKTVLEALQKADGNKRRAAEILGVSRSTLYRFFDRYRQQS